jgi:two-component system, cell cycle response regulator DivK
MFEASGHRGINVTFTRQNPEPQETAMPPIPIFIVDDNPGNLKLLRVLLSGEGFEVRTALSAGEALEGLKSFRPSLILTDIQMPGMDGLEFVRLLKAAPDTRTIPVVAITAYAMSGDESRAWNAGCDAYVTKPIDTRSLPGLLRALAKDRPAL